MPQYVAVIGDIVKSRALAPTQRRGLQSRVFKTMEFVNTAHSQNIAAKFLITIGDEFQGMLLNTNDIPELIRDLEVHLPHTRLRLGFGRGQIYTELSEFAIGMDGPAWHTARTALDRARTERKLGGVFEGFGTSQDQILNGFARVLYQFRARLTSRQRELLEALQRNNTQADVAAREGISKQAISKRARSVGLDAYREAEAAWYLALVESISQ